MFEDCIFQKCNYVFPKFMSREHWKIAGIIEEKIVELEKLMELENKKKNAKYRKIIDER